MPCTAVHVEIPVINLIALFIGLIWFVQQWRPKQRSKKQASPQQLQPEQR